MTTGENDPTQDPSISESKLANDVEETSQDDAGESPSLSSIVQESRDNLADAPPPVKNKGGRPKGSKTKNRTQPAPEAAPLPPPVLEQVSLTPALIPLVSLPFKIAADRTGFSGMKLDPEESQGIAEAFDKVLQKYLPQVSEKAGVEIMFCATFLSVVMAKRISYETWLEKNKKTNETMATQSVVIVDPKPENPGLTSVPMQNMNLPKNSFVT